MPRTFLLPDLGEGLTEADLVRWLVAEGDTVAIDQPIAEVETAKSLVEVPCPWAGVVTTLHGGTGETLEVGKPLISVDTGEDGPSSANGNDDGALSYREEERAGAVPAEPQDPGEQTAAASDDASDESEGSGNVLIGYGTSEGSGRRRRRRRWATGTETSAQKTHDTMNHAPRLAPKVTSPLVRKLAREHGVEVGDLAGSGPGGLIMRRDILGAIESQPAVDAVSAAGAAADAASAAGGTDQALPRTEYGDTVDARTGLTVAERQPVKGIRKTIGQAMTRSRQEIPEATIWVDVDVTPLVELRERLKERNGRAPGLMAFMARFALAGLMRHPELNVRVDEGPDGQEIVRFADVNLGFAAQTDRGLVVPVVRNAQGMGVEALQGAFGDLVETARAGRASTAELSGSTFTINNYGVFGTDGATPIINHPEAAILGMGRVISKPWVVDEELAVRKVMVLTLAFDHRVCDGGSAGGFLRFVADCAEDPETAITML
ncbi:2-oxo acid dehydrogenase subunit E2 [Kocuria soli]|uniref:Dihydrolipoamide acetyltransferase component of pyruvate dehydrogenase complex n=1 Tax=Kocuria soli TaxID=2485125 RepID=A0A3N3ZTU6_9MICC|nr:dihydrolipoamide acetyltransferase family protein [Kocuria soli]ROZ65731.1 2-oxo acid dehydrogenase subunit E2 [Kocuria soli]